MNHKKVYNVFQINLIAFLVICIMLVPILSVISYLFDLHLQTSPESIIIISTAIMLVFLITGLIYLLITRDHFERKLKPSYQREFTVVLSVSAIGVVGMGIMFLYLGGPQLYVPHVILPVAIVTFSLLYIIGNRYFNISLLRR
jgi:amino acid transporter